MKESGKMKWYSSEIKDLERRIRLDEDNCVIQDKYIRERFYQSACWYLRHAIFYKWLFKITSIINIILPAIVTLFNSLWNTDEFCKWVVTVLSLVTSVLGAIISFLKAHDKWINYRTVAEQLQRELSIFIVGYGNYSQNKNERIFLEHIEAIMDKEQENWISMNTDSKSSAYVLHPKKSQRNKKYTGDYRKRCDKTKKKHLLNGLLN